MKTPDLSQAPIVKRYGVRGAKLFAKTWFPLMYLMLAAITAWLWTVSPEFVGERRRFIIGFIVGVLVVIAASLLTRMRLKYLAGIEQLEARGKRALED